MKLSLWSSALLVFTVFIPIASCSGGDGEQAQHESLCAFFDDVDNCFVRLAAEADACVGEAFASSATWSTDLLSCASTDGTLVAKFGSPVAGTPEPTYDVTVEKGGALCFHYKGAGSASTPAKFQSSSITLDMTTSASTGDLLIKCEGRTFAGSIFKTNCSGTKMFPSVGTSSSGTRESMHVGAEKVYDCQ